MSKSETDAEISKALNTLTRHSMITRLEADILADMQVCKIEGWDQMEYLNELKEVIDGFFEVDQGKNGRTEK